MTIVNLHPSAYYEIFELKTAVICKSFFMPFYKRKEIKKKFHEINFFFEKLIRSRNKTCLATAEFDNRTTGCCFIRRSIGFLLNFILHLFFDVKKTEKEGKRDKEKNSKREFRHDGKIFQIKNMRLFYYWIFNPGGLLKKINQVFVFEIIGASGVFIRRCTSSGGYTAFETIWD